MSSPKPIQVPPPSHVKVTKDGRAYADIDVLIDSELERVGVPLPPQNGQQQSHSGRDSKRLQGFCRMTAAEVKAVGSVSAATSLEMIGYIRELESRVRPSEDACHWVTHPDTDCTAHETDCGQMWEFTEGGVKDNGVKFCPYCGKPVIEVVEDMYRDEEE